MLYGMYHLSGDQAAGEARRSAFTGDLPHAGAGALLIRLMPASEMATFSSSTREQQPARQRPDFRMGFSAATHVVTRLVYRDRLQTRLW